MDYTFARNFSLRQYCRAFTTEEDVAKIPWSTVVELCNKLEHTISEFEKEGTGSESHLPESTSRVEELAAEFISKALSRTEKEEYLRLHFFETTSYGLQTSQKSWYNWKNYPLYNSIWKETAPNICEQKFNIRFRVLDVEKLSKYRTELCLGRRERTTPFFREKSDKKRLMGGRLPDCLHNCVPGGPQAVWADKLAEMIKPGGKPDVTVRTNLANK